MKVSKSLAVPAALLGLVALLCGDVWLSGQSQVLSAREGDVFTYFLYARAFGFGELRHGHLPLWNPHVFSGTPFLGSFQSALFYPFNILYLLLPVDKAINADIALHLFLSGLWMYLWAVRRGLQTGAALVAAALLMGGGPYFLKVYAGHLAPLDAMAWIPLLLLAVDELWEHPTPGWCLLAIFAVAMQLLAGHPQTVFNTGVAVALFSLVRWATARPARAVVVRCLLGLLLIYAGAAALAAVQLVPGLDAAAQGTRRGGVPYDFARTAALPPENLLTLFAPGFFGNLTQFPYWGRWFLWEMSLFMGVTGLALACYGVGYGTARVARERRGLALLVVALLVLALAGYTPLFGWLYAYVPGFNRFRGHSKFIVEAAVLLALLAAMGLDSLSRSPQGARRLAAGALATGLIAAACGLCVLNSSAAGIAGTWGRWLASLQHSHESALPPGTFENVDFIHQAGAQAARSLFVCAGTGLALAALAFFSHRSRYLVWAIGALAVLEVLVFARSSHATFDLAQTRQPEIERFLAEHPGDYRITREPPDTALRGGPPDIWGYDPFILKRYAEFMAYTQGHDPDTATMQVQFSRLPPVYHMLRLRYMFLEQEGRMGLLEPHNAPPPLPRLQLVRHYRVLPDRDAIFAALTQPGFDARREVILETPPTPEPSPDPQPAGVRLVDESTDHLTIEARLPHPAILLITDAYSDGWRAVALPGSVQQSYRVLPANYVLRAIPLQAGEHHLRVEYTPPAFRQGVIVSALALVLYLAALGWWLRSTRANLAVQPAPESLPAAELEPGLEPETIAVPPPHWLRRLDGPLLALLAMALAWRPLPGATDFWAHAAVGRWIWQHRQMPHETLFLWSAHAPWIAHSWGSEVTFFGLMAAGGPSLALLFTALMAAAPFALLWRLWARQASSHWLTPWLFALAIFCSRMRFEARPELFTALCFALLLVFLVTWPEGVKRGAALGLVALFALWANLHGAVAMGLALLAVTIVCDLAQDRAQKRDATRSWRLALLGLACLGAVCLNPYGWRYFTALLPVNSYTFATIDEWKPFWRWPALPWAFALEAAALLLMAGASWAMNPRRRWAHLAWLLLLAAAFLRARRQIWLLALTCLAVLAANSGVRFVPQRWRVPPGGVMAGLLLALALALPWPLWPRTVGHTPDGMAEFIEQHHLSGNLFNDYASGSYLEWRWGESRPLFVDSLNAYSDQVSFAYDVIHGVTPKGRQLLDEAEIDIVALGHPPPGEDWPPLAAYLDRHPGWAKVYVADDGAVWVRRATANATAKLTNTFKGDTP